MTYPAVSNNRNAREAVAMRNTHGMTRSERRQRAIARASKFETHHYTDRTSVPVTSNSPIPSRKGGTITNTNLQLSRGGQSCYPRMREGFAGTKSITER